MGARERQRLAERRWLAWWTLDVFTAGVLLALHDWPVLAGVIAAAGIHWRSRP